MQGLLHQPGDNRIAIDPGEGFGQRCPGVAAQSRAFAAADENELPHALGQRLPPSKFLPVYREHGRRATRTREYRTPLTGRFASPLYFYLRYSACGSVGRSAFLTGTAVVITRPYESAVLMWIRTAISSARIRSSIASAFSRVAIKTAIGLIFCSDLYAASRAPSNSMTASATISFRSSASSSSSSGTAG